MPLDVLGRTRATLTEPASTFPWPEGHGQTWSFRGSKSRNKVSVGEPAEGSLLYNRGAGAVADFVHAPVLSHNPSHPLGASPRGRSPFGSFWKGGVCVFI